MECFENSIFLRYLKKIRLWFLAIEEEISSVYLSSFTHRLIGGTTESIKIGFKYSAFGRLTKIDEDTSKNFFQTSKATRITLNWVRKFKNKALRFFHTSNLITSIKSLKYDFLSRPLKVGGITIITAIMANVGLSTILQRHISLLGWVMRGLFLFIGISGLFSNADWPTIRNYSLILRKLRVE